MVGSIILLHNLLSQEFFVLQVAIWLWELYDAHVFSKERKPHMNQPLLQVNLSQFCVFVLPVDKLSGFLNDLMREIQI